MDYLSFRELCAARRSIRHFAPEPVPEEVILRALECARWAPSDTNQQPWQFWVVTDPPTIARLGEAVEKKIFAWQEKAEAQGHPEVARKIRVFGRYATVFTRAPAVIVMVAEPYRSRFTEEIFRPLLDPGEMAELEREEAIKSVCLAAQNLLLALHALGYGGCPLTGPTILAEREIARLLDLPPSLFPVMLIAVGKPSSLPAGPGRKPLEEVVRWVRGG